MDELPTLEAALAERDQLASWFAEANEKNARLNWLNGFIAAKQSENGQNGQEPAPEQENP